MFNSMKFGLSLIGGLFLAAVAIPQPASAQMSVSGTVGPRQVSYIGTLTYTATASGGDPATTRYAYFRRRPGGTWIPSINSPNWTASTSFNWNPTLSDVGVWETYVWAKDGNTPANMNTYGYAAGHNTQPIEVFWPPAFQGRGDGTQVPVGGGLQQIGVGCHRGSRSASSSLKPRSRKTLPLEGVIWFRMALSAPAELVASGSLSNYSRVSLPPDLKIPLRSAAGPLLETVENVDSFVELRHVEDPVLDPGMNSELVDARPDSGHRLPVFGLEAQLHRLPSGGEIGLYQPMHPTALELP